MNRKILAALAVLGAALLPATSQAELANGAKAPMFATQGALAGKAFAFNLRAALRKGPVVLYFYPKAFTQGCTLEANAFAEASDQFKAAGASVLGMSADDLPTLQRFSTEACRSRFPVAIATPAIIKGYDVSLKKPDGTATGLTSRTSYVIGQDGKIHMVYTNMDYKEHVARTLATVKAIKGGHHHH